MTDNSLLSDLYLVDQLKKDKICQIFEKIIFYNWFCRHRKIKIFSILPKTVTFKQKIKNNKLEK